MTTEPVYGIMDVETACSISKGDGKLKVAIYCRLSEEDKNKQSETDEHSEPKSNAGAIR